MHSRPSQLLDSIGETPLLDLSDLLGRPGVEILAKAEHFNPGGSVKDRPALAMLRAAVAQGELRPGRRVLDATSGNTGIAYAMIGAAMGYGVTLCVPASASVERKRILAALGAELVLTDPLEGSDGAIVAARKLAATGGDRYVYLDQYANPENWRAHYHGTGPEVWEQTAGRISHFVAGLGTSGTFVGTGRYLRERSPKIRLISMQPDSPFHGLEGLKHMATAIVPPIYDPTLADENRSMRTERAYAMARRLAREKGLLVGPSAAANVITALEVGADLDSGVVVTVLCDGAEKYLSEHFWEEP